MPPRKTLRHVDGITYTERQWARKRAIERHVEAEGSLTDRRAEHVERIREAVAALETVEGMRAFLVARDLNPAKSPLNCALVALQAPGEVVETFHGWKAAGCRVRKGERSYVRLTGRGFVPRAAFVASQTDAAWVDEMPEPETPPESLCARLVEFLRSRLAEPGAKAPDALGALCELLPEEAGA